MFRRDRQKVVRQDCRGICSSVWAVAGDVGTATGHGDTRPKAGSGVACVTVGGGHGGIGIEVVLVVESELRDWMVSGLLDSDLTIAPNW